MEDIQKTDIDIAISTHCARYRTPRFLLTDNGSSNDILNNHQQSIIEVLQKDISIEILAASHQFLNIVESTIKVFKNISRSIYHGVPAEAPLNTRAELQMIYSHVCNILNSRPLSGQGEHQLVLNSNQLTKPFLSNEDQEVMISMFMEEVFNDDDKHELSKKSFGITKWLPLLHKS